MTLFERLPGRAEVFLAGTGVMLTALAVASTERIGSRTTVLYMLALMTFVGVVAGFVIAPHVLVAATIVYFALLPTLKVFVSPLLGGTKDLIAVSALVAAGVLFIRRRAARAPGRLDAAVVVVLGLLLALYVLNIGGALSGESGHGVAWFHGVRLFGEPLALFVVGASLGNPRRALNWGVAALLAVSVANALYGVLQQAIGVEGLLAAGYEYGSHVRQIYGQLRSFGTLDEPFAYAGLLLLGLAASLVWSRRSVWNTVAVPIVAVGLLVSYVRTAALIALALVAVAAARRGYVLHAALMMVAAIAVAGAAFAAASQKTEERSVQVNPTTYLTLNGRTNIWKSTLDSPADWAFGRGVGATGTASQRAALPLTGGSGDSDGGTVVDSSYFAIIADVGIVGLAVVLALFARVVGAAATPARRGDRSAWLAIALLTVVVLDGMTRESFVGFPTAYVAMLLIGLAWGVWATDRRTAPAVEPAR
jgi:hypothetical protein